VFIGKRFHCLVLFVGLVLAFVLDLLTIEG